MTTVGVPAFGTVLVWNWHRILHVLGISGPSESRETIDVTHHASPARYREFIAGPGSGGEISLDGNLIITDALGQRAFYADLQANPGPRRTAWVVMPMDVGAAMEMEAIAKSFSPSAPHEDKISVDLTLQVTGRPLLYVVQSAGMTGLTGIEQTAGAALSITPAVAPGTYAYTCTVNTASTWVRLTVTAAGHTIRAQGALQTTGAQGGDIALGPAGTRTEIFIMVFVPGQSPRLYTLTVNRP